MPKKKKIFVIDTNVILHDSTCIHHFEENDIIIPISVLEELDHFKRGNQVINHNAREFVRTLDEMLGKKLVTEGISLGKNRGTIRVDVVQETLEEIRNSFQEDTMDHRILSTALKSSRDNPRKKVILVTKDVNLRVKAKSLGLSAEDYSSDRVISIDLLYTGCETIEDFDDNLILKLYKPPFEIDENEFKKISDSNLIPNKYYILRNSERSILVMYNPHSQMIQKVDKGDAFGIIPRNAEQTFAMDALLRKDISLVTITGTAGTGKTLLALATAIQQRGDYRQVYLARPVVPLSNKDIGFLPGDIKSKLDPYMQPLWDNLKVIQHQYRENDDKSKKIDSMVNDEKLVISPLAYIRGRSLQKIFFIVDEAQNLTPHEIKTIITRAGEGTKLIFTGDIFQIDHPYLDSQSNGLTYLIEKMKGQGVYAHINLTKGERSHLAELAATLL